MEGLRRPCRRLRHRPRRRPRQPHPRRGTLPGRALPALHPRQPRPRVRRGEHHRDGRTPARGRARRRRHPRRDHRHGEVTSLHPAQRLVLRRSRPGRWKCPASGNPGLGACSTRSGDRCGDAARTSAKARTGPHPGSRDCGELTSSLPTANCPQGSGPRPSVPSPTLRSTRHLRGHHRAPDLARASGRPSGRPLCHARARESPWGWGSGLAARDPDGDRPMNLVPNTDDR